MNLYKELHFTVPKFEELTQHLTGCGCRHCLPSGGRAAPPGVDDGAAVFGFGGRDQDPRDAVLRHRAECGLDGGHAARLLIGGAPPAHRQSGKTLATKLFKKPNIYRVTKVDKLRVLRVVVLDSGLDSGPEWLYHWP